MPEACLNLRSLGFAQLILRQKRESLKHQIQHKRCCQESCSLHRLEEEDTRVAVLADELFTRRVYIEHAVFVFIMRADIRKGAQHTLLQGCHMVTIKHRLCQDALLAAGFGGL